MPYYWWSSFANGTSSANGHFPPATLTHRGRAYFFRPFARLGSRLRKRFIEIGAKTGGVAGNRGVTEEDLLKEAGFRAQMIKVINKKCSIDPKEARNQALP